MPRRLPLVLLALSCVAPVLAQEEPRLPFRVCNETGIATDDQVFLLMKGVVDDKDCIIRFLEPGRGELLEVDASTDLSHFVYRLGELPGDEDEREFSVPRIESGRMYFSVGHPIQLRIDEKTGRIVDADGFNPRDLNYYTYYDKVEFTFTAGGTWLNPTAVDFFSVPIRVQQSGSTSGVTEAGLRISRAQAMATLERIIDREDRSPGREWGKLFLRHDDALLRLMSPGKAMNSVPGTRQMDPRYLDAERGFNYIDRIWTYYETHTVGIECKEILPEGEERQSYTFVGRVEGGQFVFRHGDEEVRIDRPESISFFAGAVGSFDAENETPKAIIVRNLTSAFDVGLLPAPDKAVLSNDWLRERKEQGLYFQPNDLLEAPEGTGPWFDLYSRALHSFGDQQPIYTFAYDDALGQDGTLHDDDGANPSLVLITLGDMSGAPIVDPFSDDQTYEVTPILGEGTEVRWGDVALATNEVVEGVEIPFKVVANGEEIEIAFDPAMVRPFTPFSGGIVIEKINDTAFRVIFPGQ